MLWRDDLHQLYLPNIKKKNIKKKKIKKNKKKVFFLILFILHKCGIRGIGGKGIWENVSLGGADGDGGVV